MTAVSDTVAPVEMSVESRLDQLSTQVGELVAEMRVQRDARERWQELTYELGPVSREAMDVATRELEELSREVTVADAAELARTLARSLPRLQSLLVELNSLAELGTEVSALLGPGMTKATDLLVDAEAKGYVTFVREGAAMVDEVVTSFTEEDVVALRENLVLILRTVKELTQPEVMTLLNRTGVSLQSIEADSGDEPPSTFALLRQMRDPQVRRGLARTLALLRTVGEERPDQPQPRSHHSHKKGA